MDQKKVDPVIYRYYSDYKSIMMFQSFWGLKFGRAYIFVGSYERV